jgi:hypothetical protein
MHTPLLGFIVAATILAGPAAAMNTVNSSTTPSTPGTVSTAPVPPCDGCDPATTASQTDTGQTGTGPITDPTQGRPAHTATPSHVSGPPKPGGGTPKG